MKKTLESKIETYLKQQVKQAGGLCFKWKSTVNGVPDQVVIYDGHTYLVEVKRPGEVPRPNQVHVHNQIQQRGVTVYTVDTNKSIDLFIQDVLNAHVPLTDNSSTSAVIQAANAFKLT